MFRKNHFTREGQLLSSIHVNNNNAQHQQQQHKEASLSCTPSFAQQFQPHLQFLRANLRTKGEVIIVNNISKLIQQLDTVLKYYNIMIEQQLLMDNVEGSRSCADAQALFTETSNDPLVTAIIPLIGTC